MISPQIKISKYLTLDHFCTCSQTYSKYAEKINPYPQNLETLQAIQELTYWIIDPIITHFGYNNFKLTYGFCSPSLRKYLDQKNEETGLKNGRIDPKRDQHFGHEKNSKGNYYCSRLGASCDFLILNQNSDIVIDWIIHNKLPFDSLYYYGINRPIHISYGQENKRDIWTFTATGQPTRQGVKHWLELIFN